MESMNVLKVVKQVKDDKHVYSLMESDNQLYVHINNYVTNKNSVIVPLEKLSELLS